MTNKDYNIEEIIDEETDKRQEITEQNTGLTFKIPQGYYYDEDIKQVFKGGARLLPIPVWITGTVHNLDEETEKLKIGIEKRGKFVENIFERRAVFGSPLSMANYRNTSQSK